MPYAIRNSIVLFILLILIGSGGGAYVFWYQADKIDEVKKEREEIRDQLGNVEELYKNLEALQLEVDMLNAAWKERPKYIPMFESATATHEYLNAVLAQSEPIDLNVLTQERVDQEGCGYIHYHVSGQGPFRAVKRFINYIEYGPRLMKLTSLDMREIHSLSEDESRIVHSVQFDAELLAYFSDQEPFRDSVDLPDVQNVSFADLQYNPFRSLVNPEIPANVYNLPEVEKSTLLAVMKDRAFISDQQNELVMLREGDEVYLGYVSKILPERRQVLFILNKGGFVERYVLTVELKHELFNLVK
ncbi:MAG: hypothetical protein GXO82_00435 [Chlorobi bacterium]|nr:hypothetical protein [Chlorobiota bacterium]